MTSILYEPESGHNAQIESVAVDPLGETVTVGLLAYPTPQSGDRIPIEIRFSKVTSISTIMDLKEIAREQWAGNVVQWHIAEKAGTSFIQLTGGLLAITSKAAPTLIGGSG